MLSVENELEVGSTPPCSRHSLNCLPAFCLKSFFARYLHGDDLRLPASIWPRIGRAHTRNLSSITEHERPYRSVSRSTSAQGTSGSGARHYRHCQVSAQSQGRAHRRRMRGRQDFHGFRHHPCTHRRPPQHHAGDVPLAYHAQVGPRSPAHDSARAHFSH
jgi:hypothetical protein